MNKYILVIDDIRFFGLFWENDLPIFYARNSDSAILFLKLYRPGISELWLDHDLGGDDTVMRAINFLEEIYVTSDYLFGDIPVIRLITSNPVGVQKLQQFANRWKIKINKDIPAMLALESPI